MLAGGRTTSSRWLLLTHEVLIETTEKCNTWEVIYKLAHLRKLLHLFCLM